MAQCPDCGLSTVQHTLKHFHKKEAIAKEQFKNKLKKKLKNQRLLRLKQ